MVLNIESFEITKSKHIGTEIKDIIDMLIFHLRQSSGPNSQAIGDVFGLSYSAISSLPYHKLNSFTITRFFA